MPKCVCVGGGGGGREGGREGEGLRDVFAVGKDSFQETGGCRSVCVCVGGGGGGGGGIKGRFRRWKRWFPPGDRRMLKCVCVWAREGGGGRGGGVLTQW